MNEENKTIPPANEPELPAFVKAAPELIPVWDWWVKDGKSTLVWVLVATLCVVGYRLGTNWWSARNAAARSAFDTAYTAADFESAVSKFGGMKAGPALKLRLAATYCAEGRYQDALDVYSAFDANACPAFADVAVVGKAVALEGLGKFAEARDAFAAYAGDEANAKSWLLFTAQLGEARTIALAGDKAAALKKLEALKAAKASDRVSTAIVDRLTDAVKRYDPARRTAELLAAADEAAKATESKAPAAAPAKPAAAPAKAPAAPAKAPAAPAKPAK